MGDVDKVMQTCFHAIVKKQHYPIVEKFLEMFGGNDLNIDIDALHDNKDHSVRDIGISNNDKEVVQLMKGWGRYLARYKIEGSSGRGVRLAPPVHASETCSVFFATDELMKDKKKSDKYHVALKLIKVEENFDRELKVRLNSSDSQQIKSGEDIPGYLNKFHGDHVVPLFRYHNGKGVLDEEDKQCQCLVLAKGTKSIHNIIDSERIAGREFDKIQFYGRDLAKAIQHMHNLNYIHGDIKPRNVIRASDGDIKIIDLDATVEIGKALSNKKKSTAYISPEVAAVEFRPTESIEDLQKELSELEKRHYREVNPKYKKMFSDDCDVLRAKIKLIEDNNNAVVSNELEADARMDIWSFGLTMYYLCTNKKPLFKVEQANDALEDDE